MAAINVLNARPEDCVTSTCACMHAFIGNCPRRGQDSSQYTGTIGTMPCNIHGITVVEIQKKVEIHDISQKYNSRDTHTPTPSVTIPDCKVAKNHACRVLSRSVRTHQRYLHCRCVPRIPRGAVHREQVRLFGVVHDDRAESRGLRVEHLKRHDRQALKTRQT